MVRERVPAVDDALAALPAGELHWLRCGDLEVALATGAGGRVAHLRYRGMEWLVDAQQAGPAAIAWGCYPMVPWAGRIRRGKFRFDGAPHALPLNFGGHAIHGVGFTRPWQVERMEAATATLSLALPCDRYWPFGGIATQEVALQPHRLQLRLSVQAGERAMPAVLGWHPWFSSQSGCCSRPARCTRGTGRASPRCPQSILFPVPGTIVSSPTVTSPCCVVANDCDCGRTTTIGWSTTARHTQPVSSRRVARRMASPWRRIGWSRGSGWR